MFLLHIDVTATATASIAVLNYRIVDLRMIGISSQRVGSIRYSLGDHTISTLFLKVGCRHITHRVSSNTLITCLSWKVQSKLYAHLFVFLSTLYSDEVSTRSELSLTF